ncbi:hypothetical protein Sme01_46850 [Sphaerisporangium melleum]|uniref:Uncharacterized protein n=1 Tax=Sphaerisporangium melleum TaxID=321316 RepID=A0A917RDC4_9ACTN|nr:hypothetical protein GCM10007964_50260 [Sphaerisporangium melleum]GII72209.1 hypothetical protein Sme01_46850 [Sphaerisporangium melleum]
MPYLDPFHRGVTAHGVGDGIEAVADHTVDPLHPCLGKNLDELFGHALPCHFSNPRPASAQPLPVNDARQVVIIAPCPEKHDFDQA